jgi:hypothetical protein
MNEESKRFNLARLKRLFTKKRLKGSILALIAFLLAIHLWWHVTNPYAAISIVKQPYKTSVDTHGDISVSKQFNLKVYNDSLTEKAVYYDKFMFTILQNNYFGSQKTQSKDAQGIIKDIHTLRFDPSKPYLISGDQFSVLYVRNLGVFYNSLLNPNTALDKKDWENRQRIYLQSALYALDAFTEAKDIKTTVVPVGPYAAALVEVHPGSVPSDSLYGLLYALDALQNEKKYQNGTYHLQTVSAAKNIVSERKADLRMLLDVYLKQVQDPKTKMIREGVKLASARDGVLRDRSFYDNVVLWKTLSLAKKLGASNISDQELGRLRDNILATYWDVKEGHFKDDLSRKPANANYSSDWLIALPTGFLDPSSATDMQYLTASVAFIRSQHIDQPFPIKYQNNNQSIDAPWAVRHFVPNYGGDAIWSYWGAQYITLLADLSRATNNPTYLDQARGYRDIYFDKMEESRGFPETFTASGDFLQNFVYKSIRQTGWVVQFEEAMYKIKLDDQN